MKIGIIGNGFVGRATYIFAKKYYTNEDRENEEIFEVIPDTVSTPAKPNSIRTYRADGVPYTPSDDLSQLGETPPPFFKRIYFKPIDVLIYDINPNLCHPKGITIEELDRECDLLFFCLPTPLNHDGSCYTKILEDTIARFSNPYKIIRSTIPVGFAAKHRCYFMPEFLTEASWENDFYNNKEWIVGIPRETSNASTHIEDVQNHEFKQRITKLIKRSHKNGSIKSNKIVFCDTNEAEMLKLMKNCFLSAKVGIMNEFFDFCNATNTAFNNVTDIAKLDARMGTSHFQVPGPDGRRGFGGTCFPKDTHSLYCQMTAKGIHPHIYPAILTRNDTHDRPEREWAKDVWRTTIPLPTPQSKVVVVFTNTHAASTAYVSCYFDDIIRTNLSKHNVVIQVVRDSMCALDATKPLGENHLIKYWSSPSNPLFFPRVDECYYCPYDDTSSYQTTKDVMSIIDLWNSHEEMILYIVKNAKDADSAADNDNDNDNDNESGTEGFDDDNDDHVVRDTITTHKSRFDYARIFEDYYRETFEGTNRRLVIMF
jgi:UDPglucose 6-dehydrogenase